MKRGVYKSYHKLININLEHILKTQKISYLAVMGVQTCRCVLATVRDALKKGFTIITAPDLISGITPRQSLRIEQCFKENPEPLKNYQMLNNYQEVIEYLNTN